MFNKILFVSTVLLFSVAAKAEFDLKGQGHLLFPTGTQTPLDFGFSFTKGEYGFIFNAGQQKLEVQRLPEKYSIWMSVNKEELVYVQEFSRTYFTEFEWQLGDHSMSLKKKILKPKRAKADYVLTIDNIDYFFKGNQGNIDILFDEDGIGAIEANGFVKDIGMVEEN